MRSALLSSVLLVLLFAAAGARADETKGPKHKMTQADSFVMIEPFYTAIFDEGRPIGMLMVGFGLDIPDPVLRAQADAGMPLLRDYYLRSLASFSATSLRPWAQPDVNEIAARLQRVTNRALRRPGAKVLLAQVAMRLSR